MKKNKLDAIFQKIISDSGARYISPKEMGKEYRDFLKDVSDKTNTWSSKITMPIKKLDKKRNS